jgi:hypothetical protein
MKVTLDLSELLEQGRISPAEAERLRELALPSTSTLAINILIGTGVIAVAAGAVALLPLPATAAAIGAALFAGGLGIVLAAAVQWSLLGQICLIVGALMVTGGVVTWADGALASLLAVIVLLFAGAVAARSSLLMVGAVLAVGAAFGARSAATAAAYDRAFEEPAMAIVVFSLLALVSYRLSRRVTALYERLAVVTARTALLLVNLGFWIGSISGDTLDLPRALLTGAPITKHASGAPAIIPDTAFSVVWALALIGVALWGARAQHRWVVNVAAIFGVIHFYTQWFERLGTSAGSVLTGGLLMLAFAFGLWRFNRKAETGNA